MASATEKAIGNATFGMPEEEMLVTGAFPGGNRLYKDLRGRYTWADARTTLREDRAISRHLRSLLSSWEMREEAAEVLAVRANMDLDVFWDEYFPASPFSHLDVGVASSVVALVALGAAPIISCNGCVFGDPHFHPHPLIAFYAPATSEQAIVEAARAAKLHLEQNDFTKSPMLAALRIQPFLRFADILCKAHS